jgi:hypothetical protein
MPVMDQNVVPEPDGFEFFYSLADSKLLTLLIVVAIIIVIVLLVIFRCLITLKYCNDTTNSSVGTYLGIVGLPVGVILSFIVASAWAKFSDAQTKEIQEGSKLFSLYSLLGEYGGSQALAIQNALKEYLAEIINDEFILMAQRIQPTRGFDMLTDIGDMIYQLEPSTSRESGLFSEAVTLYGEIVELRIARAGYVAFGLSPELWWVLVLGVVIVIAMSFFIYIKYFLLQFVLSAMITATLVSMLFLIVAFNFPYRGDFGLDDSPFRTALQNMQ